MCGIFGFISPNSRKEQLEASTNRLLKRGPDAAGYHYRSPLGLGHRRLSVIDLSTGDQPMHSEDGSVIIVFNGEIYNFKEIRQELDLLGVHFSTESDTEVIINSYIKWGLEVCLQKIEGMFAFALWDEKKQELYVVRDRFGEKPLYYTHNETGFYFASELKALNGYFDKREISQIGINLYFSLTYIPAPLTIYENVFKLEPGNYISVNAHGSYKTHCYYDLSSVVSLGRNQIILDYSEAKKELREKLFESVQNRMVADVPLGAFLSGGIDSSIISAIMAKISQKPINTFSIGFKEKSYDESERAALVAKHIGSNHTLHIVGHEDLLKVVDETLSYFDEPFGDSSAIPSMILAQKSKEKVTVVLTGDCADELFGGYEKYLGKYYAEKYNNNPKFIRTFFEAGVNIIPHTNATNQLLRKIKKVIKSANLNPEKRYLKLASLGFGPEDKKTLLSSKFYLNSDEDVIKYFKELNIDDELTQTFYSDVKLVLEGDMLTKVDRACMLNSLEARVPFLDSQLVSFAFKLPNEFKIKGTIKKRILRDTFSDLLPSETLTFSKRGFGLPLRIWFRHELKKELMQLLDEKYILAQGVFNYEYINRLLGEHMSLKENHSSKLWVLYVFQKWYQKNVNL